MADASPSIDQWQTGESFDWDKSSRADVRCARGRSASPIRVRALACRLAVTQLVADAARQGCRRTWLPTQVLSPKP